MIDIDIEQPLNRLTKTVLDRAWIILEKSVN